MLFIRIRAATTIIPTLRKSVTSYHYLSLLLVIIPTFPLHLTITGSPRKTAPSRSCQQCFRNFEDHFEIVGFVTSPCLCATETSLKISLFAAHILKVSCANVSWNFGRLSLVWDFCHLETGSRPDGKSKTSFPNNGGFVARVNPVMIQGFRSGLVVLW